jgi:hypothetical protein
MDNRVLEVTQSPILITGCARSGTSLVAGIVNICGGFGGDMRPGNKYNEKGLFENRKIQELDKAYLKSINCDPKGQNPLPDTTKLPLLRNWKESVEELIVQDGYKEGPWFYKGARTCLTWPLWHLAFPNAKWVIVRRRSSDIAESCLKTSFMNGYSTYEEWIKWINHHEDCFVEMIKAGLNVKMVWPDRMVKGNYEQMYELVDWLGLKWKAEEVMQFIEPKLWKAKVKGGIV